jgi:hypothetical protein
MTPLHHLHIDDGVNCYRVISWGWIAVYPGMCVRCGIYGEFRYLDHGITKSFTRMQVQKQKIWSITAAKAVLPCFLRAVDLCHPKRREEWTGRDEETMIKLTLYWTIHEYCNQKRCNNAWPDLPLYDMNPKTPPYTHARLPACHAAVLSTLHVFFFNARFLCIYRVGCVFSVSETSLGMSSTLALPNRMALTAVNRG